MEKNINRMILTKKIKTFGDTTGYFLLHVNHSLHIVELLKVSGQDIGVNDFIEIMTSDRDVVKELIWASKQNRSGNLRILYHQGRSGCEDYTLLRYPRELPEWACSEKRFIRSRFSMHISCANKISDSYVKIRSDDLLDLLFNWMSGGDYYGYSIRKIIDNIPIRRNRYCYLKWEQRDTEYTCSVCGSMNDD